MVRDVDLGFDDLVTACVGYIEALRWAELFDIEQVGGIEALARELVAYGAEIAAEHAAGAVLRTVFDRDRQQWRYTDA